MKIKNFVSIVAALAIILNLSFAVSADYTNLLGDINLSNTVDSDDALSVLRSSVGIDFLEDEQPELADVVRDGKIDSSDALAILRISAGFEAAMPKYTADFLTYINNERAKNGLKPLIIDSNICEAAKARAEVSASVANTDISTADAIEKYFGPAWMIFSENKASGLKTPEEVFDKWLSSESQRKNILSDRISRIGISLCRNNDTDDVFGYYWVLILVGVDSDRPDYSENANYINDVLKFTNQERDKEGCNPLTIDENLNKIAQQRAEEVTKSLTHVRPDGSGFESLVDKIYGTNWVACGENIAAGQKNGEEAVASWMKSPEHRKHILDKRFNKMGVGLYKLPNDEFTYYWIQIFVASEYDGKETGNANDPTQSNIELAKKAVQLINEERLNAGVNEITFDENLYKASSKRAEELFVSWSATRPDGSPFDSVITEYAGENWSICSELISAGQKSPESLIRTLVKNEGSKANMINADFKKVGVGVYINENDPYQYYWSVIFTD